VLSFGESRTLLSTIVAIVLRSPIRVTAQRAGRADLPAVFDDLDLAILEWIAAESQPVRLRPPLH
jgi:hypothetical protein